MISQNEFTTDAEDVAVLFYAICRYAEATKADTGVTLHSVGYAECLNRATSAASYVAASHRDEGDEWDGVVWYERISSTGPDSLAAQLFTMRQPYALRPETTFTQSNLRVAVLAWLADHQGVNV